MNGLKFFVSPLSLVVNEQKQTVVSNVRKKLLSTIDFENMFVGFLCVFVLLNPHDRKESE